MTTAGNNGAFVHTLFDALNRRDLDRAVTLLDKNVQFVHVPTGERFDGLDGFRQAILRSWGAFPDMGLEITDLLQADEGVAVEYVARGTNTGPLDMPTGRIAPTGRGMELRACDLYRIKNGKVVTAHVYYDMAMLQRQLGLAAEVKQTGL